MSNQTTDGFQGSQPFISDNLTLAGNLKLYIEEVINRLKMEAVFEVIKELEDEGYTIECGWKEKQRKKEMSEAMKKLKESGDENKIKIAKRLTRYYGIFHNIGLITTCPEFPSEEDKYGLHYLHIYLENFVDSAKRSISGVMTAFANDEKLDPFFKDLMLTHLYSSEEIAEIDCE